jgi:hypothetical protein
VVLDQQSTSRQSPTHSDWMTVHDPVQPFSVTRSRRCFAELAHNPAQARLIGCPWAVRWERDKTACCGLEAKGRVVSCASALLFGLCNLGAGPCMQGRQAGLAALGAECVSVHDVWSVEAESMFERAIVTGVCAQRSTYQRRARGCVDQHGWQQGSVGHMHNS